MTIPTMYLEAPAPAPRTAGPARPAGADGRFDRALAEATRDPAPARGRSASRSEPSAEASERSPGAGPAADGVTGLPVGPAHEGADVATGAPGAAGADAPASTGPDLAAAVVGAPVVEHPETPDTADGADTRTADGTRSTADGPAHDDAPVPAATLGSPASPGTGAPGQEPSATPATDPGAGSPASGSAAARDTGPVPASRAGDVPADGSADGSADVPPTAGPLAAPATGAPTAAASPAPPAGQQSASVAAAPEALAALQPAVTQPAAAPAAAPAEVVYTARSATGYAELAEQVRGPVLDLRNAAPGEHVLTLRIRPEHLGPVQVRAHIGADGVRVELVGATEASREGLRQILGDLRRDLAATGMTGQLSLGDGGSSADEDAARGRSAFEADDLPVAPDHGNDPSTTTFTTHRAGDAALRGGVDVMA